MKDTVGLVPQVFYDLIGRVVPGAAILVVGTLLLRNGDYAVAAAFFAAKQPSIFIPLALLASYLLGVLLGAVGFALVEDYSSAVDPVSKREPQADDDPGSDQAFIYDFISLRDAGASGRLAKLRAELHMCRVLIAGCFGVGTLYVLERTPSPGGRVPWGVLLLLFAIVVLVALESLSFRRRVLMAGCIGLGAVYGIANISSPGDRKFWVVIVSLTAAAGASYLFHNHLRIRIRRLMTNCWSILKEAEPSLGLSQSGRATHDR